MKIGKRKPPGIAGVQPARKVGDPKPEGYRFGRPTTFRPEYCQSIIDFFTRDSWELVYDAKGTAKVIPKDNIPTLIRWCTSLGIHRRTVYDWIKTIPEFADAHDTAMELQKAFLMESGIVHGSGGFASFMLKCVHGMQEPKADADEKEDGPIQRVVVEVVGANQHKGD